MKRLFSMMAGSLVAVALGGCMHMADPGWVTLIDGKRGLENFDRTGDANWRGQHDYIVADAGKGGHLVSKKSYKDFILKAEFWADDTTNSGIFLRASDPRKVGAANAYEVNIYDQRPGPEYATGAIVNYAMVPPGRYKAGGQWNTYEIYAVGPEVIVKLNGVVTVAMRNDQFKEGPFTLQYGSGPKGVRGGTIRWRKVEIKEL
jgi:3-keto-disaccharide hydrolase